MPRNPLLRNKDSFLGVSTAHLRDTIKLSGPVVIGQLGIILTGVIDNMMVGWLSYNHLSAASFANGVYFLLVVFAMGITNAISPLVAEADATGDREASSGFLRQSVWLGIGSSLITVVLMEVAIWLMPYMGQPESDVVLGSSYLRWVYASVPPLIIFLVYKGYTDGLSKTRVAMIVTILGLAFNALANWVLIFGNWGFPRWELDGAGIATLVTRLLMLVALVAVVHRAPTSSILRLTRQSWRFHWTTMKKVLSIGLPSGFQLFFEVGAFAGAVIILGWIGPASRSAHQIAINLSSITYMVVVGIAAGASIRVGNARGRQNMLEAREAGNAGLFLGTVFMSLSAIVFALGRDFLPTLYNDHPDVLSLTTDLMLFAAFFQIFDGAQAIGLGILRGLQDVLIPMMVAFVCYWLIGLPLGYITTFTLGWGVNGMWLGFVVSLGIAAIVFWVRFRRLTRTDQSPE